MKSRSPLDPPALLGATPVTAAEVEAYGRANDFGLLDEHKGRDGWLRCEIDPRLLRDMHGTFGRDGFDVDLEKGRRFGELIELIEQYNAAGPARGSEKGRRDVY